jgi:DNA-binding LacI/PurR family transcriptional regulator
MARTTIKDVALAAGVSTTTVSHALNGTRYVSRGTRERIRAVAERLSYRPDPIARALQGQDTLLIGHIIRDLVGNPFFAQVARGADRHAQELGYATILSYTDMRSESEHKAVHLLLEKRVNGIIFNTPETAENVALAVAAGVAAVMIERPFTVPGAHAVVTDHHRGLYDLTRVLIEQGHRRIAFIGGELSMPGSAIVERRRLRGFHDALREAGLSVPPAHVLLVPYRAEPARVACRQALEAHPQPTALVVGSDLLVSGVLQVLYERHLRVPDDISVVSFDDTLGAHMAPPLTEAEPATEDMGRQAVDLIVQHCRQPAGTPRRSKRITLQPRIHHRASTGPVAGDYPAVPLASLETVAHAM